MNLNSVKPAPHATLLLACCMGAMLAPVHESSAQIPEKEVESQFQWWAGYMTSGKISEKFSLWNDFHYVPDGFAVFRTGLSFNYLPNFTFTGGYAYLRIPVSSAGVALTRQEHRPWAQMVVNHKVGSKLQMSNRVRYDMRYRERFGDGQLLGGYNFNHRVRLLISIRYPLKGYEIRGGTPFLSLTNEVLVNFGKEVVYNHLDQNRLWLTGGFQFENFTFQTGYMHRYVQLGTGNRFVLNHTLLLWVTHNFDLRSVKRKDIFFRLP